MTTVADIQLVVERLWPAAGAEAWDAVGLIAGDPAAVVERVLLAVDATLETAAEAQTRDVQLLLVHHPLLLRGVTTIAEYTPKGAVLGKLLRRGVALLAAHTNADVVDRGTSAELARSLGLTALRTLDGGEGDGIGRVGELAAPSTLGDVAARVAEIVPPTASGIRVAGDPASPVRTVAICAGAGDGYLEHPAVLAADVYVTGDLRHHPASDARERWRLGAGPALIDVPHWAAESLWLRAAADELGAALPGLEFIISSTSTDPWDLRIDQERP